MGISANNQAGVSPRNRSEFILRDKAMAGDLVFVATPATVNRAATSSAWTRTVVIELRTAAGERHTWFNKAITSGASIADTSTAGTASIPSTTVTYTEGRATIVVSGTAAAWLATETNTLTIAAATILGYTVASKTSVETIV
jgi:hypothetical protein